MGLAVFFALGLCWTDLVLSGAFGCPGGWVVRHAGLALVPGQPVVGEDKSPYA